MYWDFPCDPYELSGQWQNFLAILRIVFGVITVFSFLGIFIPMGEDKFDVLNNKLWSIAFLVAFSYLTWLCNSEIVKSNMQCFGTPFFGG